MDVDSLDCILSRMCGMRLCAQSDFDDIHMWANSPCSSACTCSEFSTVSCVRPLAPHLSIG